MNVGFDEKGNPVLFADVAPAGVTRRDVDAASGNPHHDIRSGKFGGSRRKPNVATPPNVDPLEFARLLDAARDAARQYDNLDAEEIKEFLAGRAKNPEVVDVNNFLRVAREWKKTDLVDLIDQKLRGSKGQIKISTSRNFLKGSLNGLTPEEQAEVLHRLEAKGYDRNALDKFFNKRVDDSTPAKEKRDQIEASDEWSFDSSFVFEDNEEELIDPLHFAQEITKKIPQPVVHVHPQITVAIPKPMRREIIRDENTGLAIGTREIYEDE